MNEIAQVFAWMVGAAIFGWAMYRIVETVQMIFALYILGRDKDDTDD